MRTTIFTVGVAVALAAGAPVAASAAISLTSKTFHDATPGVASPNFNRTAIALHFCNNHGFTRMTGYDFDKVTTVPIMKAHYNWIRCARDVV